MFEDIKLKILKEYPFLENSNLAVIKQFVSTDGRVSSTYLLTSDKKGYKTFIAKTFNEYSKFKSKNKNNELLKEYEILKKLNTQNILAPIVLSPSEPVNFLLMSFMNGENASVVAQDKEKVDILFKKMGEAVGQLHSVKMDHFGEILGSEKISWKELQLAKMEDLSEKIKELLDKDTFELSRKQFFEREYLLEDESRGDPVLLPHDIYLENFLFDESKNKAIYVDFGIALAGRPFFDLAKFYIWTLNDYPSQKDNFLKGYSKFIDLPNDFEERLNMYIIRECFGMINFFNIMQDKKMIKSTIEFLERFIKGESHIQNL